MGKRLISAARAQELVAVSKRTFNKMADQGSFGQFWRRGDRKDAPRFFLEVEVEKFLEQNPQYDRRRIKE